MLRSAVLLALATLTFGAPPKSSSTTTRKPTASPTSYPGSGKDCALLDQYNYPCNAFGATAFAFLYGEPLNYFEQLFKGPIGLALLGTNKFNLVNGGRLDMPGDTQVIHPNVDTLYGIAFLDLSEADVEVAFPKYDPGRVFVVDFWDP